MRNKEQRSQAWTGFQSTYGSTPDYRSINRRSRS